jgi:DNA-binding MarR family transcriptional regulator
MGEISIEERHVPRTGDHYIAAMPRNRDDLDAATQAFLVASRALVGVAARSLAGVDDVTLPQYRALVVLQRPVPVTVGDLAATLDIHRSTATRLCDRLERKGLVRRRPGASEDRRETSVTLTAKGRRLVDRVTEHRVRDLHMIASWMSPADRQRAIAGLTAFAVAAGELPGVDRFGWADYVGDAPTTS